ncbi:MAG: RluA family pseudouridine synthase [Muribaculaceae bacterium]|nr:RluA family pseudouridine synthase [Muribaculaceae bacterium]
MAYNDNIHDEELPDEIDGLFTAIDDEDEEGGEPSGMFEHFRFVADKGQQLLRVDKFLVDHMQRASRNRIQQAAEAGCILANGKPVKSNYRVKPDDVISVVMDRPRYEHEVIAEDIPLDIVYEDNTVLVVNKPAGLVVHPGHGNYTGTLVNALAWHFRNNPDYDVNDPRMGLVHRIDKDTSGLLVIAKTPDAKTHLGKQFFNKTTKREYVAVVWGIPQPDKGTITGNIARNPKDRLQMAVFPPDGEIGKHAVTHYEVIEKLNYVSVVKCVLETGRTHQIRVHMMHTGHPLLNDARYGGDEILRGNTSAKYRQFVRNCFEVCPRQALHARTLGFVHPATGKEMFFTSAVPDDMTAMIERWRKAVF